MSRLRRTPSKSLDIRIIIIYNDNMRKSIVGQKVYIKANKTEWGIVTVQVDNDLFVAMFEDMNEQRLFERDEVVLAKG